MSDRLEQRAENNVTSADIVNGQLVFKRYDYSTLTFGEFVEDVVLTSVEPNPSYRQGYYDVTVRGSGFTPNVRIWKNGVSAGVETTFIDESTLTFGNNPAMPNVTELSIQASNGPTGTRSNVIVVPLVDHPDNPTLTALTPSSGTAGVVVPSLTLHGTKFTPGTWELVVGGFQKSATYVSSTELTLVNWTPGGGSTNIYVNIEHPHHLSTNSLNFSATA
jgi:hypothetical protein